MKKLTWEQFKEIMEKANKEKNSIKGVIVFKPESFDKEFSEESRSYEVGSDNKYWNPMMGGSSLFGYCLDGTDQGARLDWYMHAVPEDNLGKRWLVDYCYLLDDVKEEKTESIKTEATDLYTNKTNLEKGFADEVIFHLESLANDGIEEAKPILDDSDKVNEIVQELINGCDDIWESIHLKIEELAGINFRDKISESKDEEEAEAKVKEAFKDGYKEKVKVIKEESLASDAAQRINQNDRYEGKEMQTEEGMLATKIATVAEYLGDDYSEWLDDQSVKEIIEEIKESDVYANLDYKLNELIVNLVEDKVDWIRRDDPASRYYEGEEELDENKKLSEDYTQASNAGAIKVDVMGQPTKKNKKDKEDPIIKSLPAQQVLIEGKEESEYEEIEEKIEEEIYDWLTTEEIYLEKGKENLTNDVIKEIKNKLDDFRSAIIQEYMTIYDEYLVWDYDISPDGSIKVNVWNVG